MSLTKECTERFHQRLEEIAAEEKKETLERTKMFHASTIGWANDCLRHLYMSRVPEYVEQVMPEPNLQKIFIEGKQTEEATMKVLQSILPDGLRARKPKEGWIVEACPGVEISYHPDAKVSNEDKDEVAIGEIKGMASSIYGRFAGAQDAEIFLQQREPYLRHYYPQVLLYMYADEYQSNFQPIEGFFMVKNKLMFDFSFIPIVHQNPEAMLTPIFEKLDVVQGWLKKGDEPPAEFKDACGGCKFQPLCFPGGVVREEGLAQVKNIELEELLKKMSLLEASVKEYEEAEKTAKATIKALIGKGYPPNLQIGHFIAKMSEYERTIYEIPAEIKNQFAKKIPVQAIRIRSVGEVL